MNQGSATYSPFTKIEATPKKKLDHDLFQLDIAREEWTNIDTPTRLTFLERTIAGFSAIAEDWVRVSLEAKGVTDRPEAHAQEWISGPYCILRNLRLLKKSLEDINNHGVPQLPRPAIVDDHGQVRAQIFPADGYDRVFFRGTTAEVWMDPEVSLQNLSQNMAAAYREPTEENGFTSLVLGGGNVSSIGPMDALYKLFVENKVVLLKMHPVNAYLGRLLEKGFQSLIDGAFLRIVYGGAEEGAYLCNHQLVDDIHITGSDKTHDLIVFGADVAAGKASGKPSLDKPISSELGNVSPVIVLPGPWSDKDLDFHAENLVSSLINNAGFNCNASRVLICHEQWPQRETFFKKIGALLAKLPSRKAYYPGAHERFERFLAAHPDAELYGEKTDSDLPWMFIRGLDSSKSNDICFQTEAFCGLFGETALEAPSIEAFLERALALANDVLWGSLNITLIAHPRSLKKRSIRESFERVIGELKYGTVSVNHWAGAGYALVSTPWGAYPGHDLFNIQSGQDMVHNTFMFDKPQKTVIRGPFRQKPKPAWFLHHRQGAALAKKMAEFEADPGIGKLPGIFYCALRG